MLTLLCGADFADAAIQCYECHGSRNPLDYRPVDASYRNVTTGGFVGNHRAHVAITTDFSECPRCHPGSAAFSSSHRDGMIKVSANINGSPLQALYRNSTSAFPQTSAPSPGTCSSVNCHFERTTQTWGGPLLTYPGGCNACHGAPPAGGETGAAGSHVKHDAYYSGAGNCKKCHADHITFYHATSAGRDLVVIPRNPADVPEGYYTGTLGNYLPSQAKTFGSCVNTYCHSNGTSPATGAAPAGTSRQWGATGSCNACHGFPPVYASGSPKENSHRAPEHSQFKCNKCHATTTSNGTTVTNPALHANAVYNVSPSPAGLFSYTYAPTGGTCGSVGCHFDSSDRIWGARLTCDYCHDAPPYTPAHLRHYGGTVADSGYGDTRITQDFSTNATAYVLNCGNCHPMDIAKHRNGNVDVELYNPLAPAGSLKALNPPSAGYTPGVDLFFDNKGYSYTKGSCANVYCHSYNDWTTPGGVPQSTNPSYLPPNLVTTRYYRTVTWEGPHLGCSGCHANPPRTSAPANDGGAGNSHSWIDEYGYESFHNYNMGFDPVSCSYCHNDTVRGLNSWTHDEMWVATLSEVPIYNYARHVNGLADVAFDRVNTFPFTTPYSLANAAYDPATKTCSNISCHRGQTSVIWGTPYRWYYDPYECNRCHTY
jgi:predicted CxxxxCH...CXXCH cytochrome family protein